MHFSARKITKKPLSRGGIATLIKKANSTRTQKPLWGICIYSLIPIYYTRATLVSSHISPLAGMRKKKQTAIAIIRIYTVEGKLRNTRASGNRKDAKQVYEFASRSLSHIYRVVAASECVIRGIAHTKEERIIQCARIYIHASREKLYNTAMQIS